MLSLIALVLMGLSVESRIDSVIAYADQALVIRTARVSLSGSEPLVFRDLTGSLDDNTIRIRAPGLLLGEVQVKPGFYPSPTSRVKVLEDSLERLESQDRAYADEQEVIKARDSFLSSIKLGAPELLSRELGAGRIDVTSWGAALNFMTGELTANRRRATELNRLRQELFRTKSALTQELAQARARYENRKTITVQASAATSGVYPVTLSYAVPYSVTWTPYYELRARPATSDVAVSYYAQVSQRTNEDWENVSLVLSTARPSAGGVAPQPEPWYLNLWEPRVSYGKGSGYLMAPGAARAEDVEAVPERAVPARPTETGVSLQYAIPGRVSLASGEEGKKLLLADARVSGEFGYYCYPRKQELAYLRARFQNSSDHIFLAGPGNTYVGDEFTGKTLVPNIAPGESSSLDFGVDDRVKVRHELVKTLTARSGLFGGRVKQEFVYRTTIENFHPRAESITVIEQIPVSRHKDISVTLNRLEPDPTETNKDLGTFTFRLLVKPQQRMVINLAYSVEYPSGKQVGGLY